MATLALAPDYGWFVAGLALWGISGGVAGAVPRLRRRYGSRPEWNAATMSSFRMVSEFGYVIGPLLLGWIADLSGGEAALYTTSGSLP